MGCFLQVDFGPLSVSLAFLTCSVPVVICFLLGLLKLHFSWISTGDLCWWHELIGYILMVLVCINGKLD